MPTARTSPRAHSRTDRRALLAVVLTALLAAPLLMGCFQPYARPVTLEYGEADHGEGEPWVFAVIGDYGSGDSHEAAVARLVASWDPEVIITTGDDYYSSAGGHGDSRYDRSTGDYYGRWLPDRFFPTLGNHDYTDATPSLETYLEYFSLPEEGSGNERYYDFTVRNVHFYALNTNPVEPDMVHSTSRQADWLQERLGSSASRFDIVFGHHPPYSSDSKHGSSKYMRWPFAEWGAEVVLSGHAHTYERVERSGIVYMVNGLGGAERYGFGDTHVDGSAQRYSKDWGAQKVTVSGDSMTFEFYNVEGEMVDRRVIDPR